MSELRSINLMQSLPAIVKTPWHSAFRGNKTHLCAITVHELISPGHGGKRKDREDPFEFRDSWMV